MFKLKLFVIILSFMLLNACQTMTNEATSSRTTNEIKQLYQLATTAYLAKDWDKAKEYLIILAKETPSDTSIWLKLGNIYARNNQAEQAIESYQQGLKYDPKNAKIWHNLAVMQLRLATVSFIQVTKYTTKNDPLYVRATDIIDLYDQVQTTGNY